jgi:hypothetical protein
MFSKSVLVPLLQINGFATDSISYEAYGRKVMAYIGCKDMQTRRSLEAFLCDRGQKVNRNYWPGHALVEVQVTYFKAPHWDE